MPPMHGAPSLSFLSRAGRGFVERMRWGDEFASELDDEEEAEEGENTYDDSHMREERGEEGCESASFSADSVSAVDDVEDSGVSAREGEGEEAGALAMGRRTTAKEKPIRTTRRAESRTHHRRCVLL